MTHRAASEAIATVGIDLGKNTFHLIGMDARGRIVLRRKIARGQLLQCLANVPACLIGMEACTGAHHVGRQLAALGHDVHLLPADYVKPFLKGHKNDYRDAEAIAEAAQRPTMRPVPLKSAEQLDLQALHRVRSRRIGQRTAIINQIRGFLLECGIAVRQGPARLRDALPAILAQEVLALTGQRRDEVGRMAWEHLDLRRKVWIVPGEHAKNGKPHLVHLSEPVLALLEAVPRSGELVFSGDGRRAFQGYSKAKAKLDELSGVDDWTLHDLRRTVVSGMARLGVAPHVADKILNHQSGTISGVAAVYQRHEFLKERQDALQLWGQHVASLHTPRSSARVVRSGHRGRQQTRLEAPRHWTGVQERTGVALPCAGGVY